MIKQSLGHSSSEPDELIKDKSEVELSGEHLLDLVSFINRIEHPSLLLATSSDFPT